MPDLERLLRIPHIDTGLRYDLRPDGGKAAFSWNGSGNWEIYELTLGQIDSAPRKISQGRGSKFAPQYSPNGRYLAYACDLDGSESYHIILHDFVTGMSRDMTPDIDYAHQPNFAFSPDGTRIAILSDERGQFAVYVMPLSGGKPKLVMDIHRPCWDVRWSPTSTWMCVEAETTASERGLFITSVDGGKPFQICKNGRALNAQHAAWSPDGKTIAFSGEHAEWHDIGLFDLPSGSVNWADQTAGDDELPCWSHDGRRMGWVHSRGVTTNLVVREQSGALHSHKIVEGLHHHPQFTKEGNHLVFIAESPSRPPDLWMLNLDQQSFKQLTYSMPAGMHITDFIQPEEVRYSSDEGIQVPALLYRSRDGSRAVVNIHGGPNWRYQFMWHPVMSHMASRGWTVLAPNYRGSTGYGKKWQNASRFDMGGADARDCAAGAKYLIDNGLADENKIAVTGQSHGGYLTMMCMTMHPGLWAAGSAVVPFLNWLKSHGESREDLRHWNIENMGDPETHRELWISRSPSFFLDRVTAPVQLICGGNDPRCPASDTIEAHNKLVELGKQVELLVYEDAGHGFLDTNVLTDCEMKRMDFLAKFLDRQD